jgi:FdrA protein
VVLGYGCHADPGGVMAASIREASAIAQAEGRSVTFVGSICGTDLDPQGLASQEATLRDAGAMLLPSNARAVRTALALIAAQKETRAS